jgi:arylsulfatase A-like enzyme
MSSGPRLSAVLLLVAIAAPACAPAPRRELPAVERYPAPRGAVSTVRIGRITRPALRLPADGVVRWRTNGGPGSRLLFAVGATDHAEAVTGLAVDVEAGGRPAYQRRVPLSRDRWFPCVVPLDASAPLEIAIRVRPEKAPGAALRGDEDVRIALSVPRLYRGRPGSPPARPPRTLVWISQDALRADHLGAYGYGRATSPFFDRVSQGFFFFERAMSTSSWTLQSMASQFTSLYPSVHGANARGLGLRPDAATLFESLAADGFTVLGVVGNQFLSSDFGLARGFDVLAYEHGPAGDLNWLALRLLATEVEGEDVALFVHYVDPHATYEPPAPYDSAFPTEYTGKVDTTFGGLNRLSDPRHVERAVALYDGEILYADTMIQRLLDTLGQKGRLERAVVAYTADHGEEFKDHGGFWHGATLYQELLHVPFALKVPGLAPRRVPEAVSLIDLAPTLLDAVGAPPARGFRGRSLLPLLKGASPASSEALVAETGYTPDGRVLLAYRESDRKLILHLPAGHEREPRVLRTELFDLAADGRELVDRAAYPEAARLRDRALAFVRRARAEAAPDTPAVLDAETKADLKALGYFE